MDKMPSVGIIVVNYKGFEITSECIDSLLAIDYPNHTIVCVDNGSRDGSGDKLGLKYQDRIELIQLADNVGVTGGNNRGIEYAKEHNLDYVMFLNNDTIVDESFLRSMVQASLENKESLVAPKIICYYDKTRLDHWIGSDFNWWMGVPKGYRDYPKDEPELNIKTEAKVASTCCLLVPMKVVRDVGVMDENYFIYYDDADYTIRATNAGYRIIYEPAAQICHKCGTTASQKLPPYFQYYLEHRNLVYLYSKLCRNPVAKYAFFIKKFCGMATTFAGALVKRDTELIGIIGVTIQDILSGKLGSPDFTGLARVRRLVGGRCLAVPQGWYAPERDGSSAWRWTSARGALAVTVPATTSLQARGEVRSIQVPNSVEVLAKGQRLTTLPITQEGWAPFEFSLEVGPDTMIIEFVSHNPATVIATDSRPLAIAVKDLTLTLGEGGGPCDVDWR